MTPPRKSRKQYLRIGQRIRLTGPPQYASMLADVRNHSAHGLEVRVYSGNERSPVLVDSVLLTGKGVSYDVLRGKPYIAGVDAPRAMGSRKLGTSTPPRSTHTPSRPGAAAPMTTTTPTTKPSIPDSLPATIGRDELTRILATALATAQPKGTSAEDVQTLVYDTIDKVFEESVEPRIRPLINALSGIGETREVARVRVAAAAMTGNVFLDKLTQFYRPGHECPAHVLLASPPSFGKSHAVRMLGETYGQYFEHGCSDDMDEVATLLGNPVPDGHGGFIVVDGVLTQAVRAAATGQTVLLLLDEVLRLTPRAQEWLLTFLTGVKRGDGTRDYVLRTRRAMPDGTLEVLTCRAADLHIVAATNLSILSPIEAFWSRFDTVRVDFNITMAEGVGKAILASYGIDDPDNKLAKTWAGIMNETRQKVADNTLKYPADFRMLERAAAMARQPIRKEVALLLSERLQDNVANWNPDMGDVVPESAATCVPLITKLKSL